MRRKGALESRYGPPGFSAQPRASSPCAGSASDRTGIHTFRPDLPYAVTPCAASASIAAAETERVDARSYRVRGVVRNTGWLPTYVTQRALERQLVGPVRVELEG